MDIRNHEYEKRNLALARARLRQDMDVWPRYILIDLEDRCILALGNDSFEINELTLILPDTRVLSLPRTATLPPDIYEGYYVCGWRGRHEFTLNPLAPEFLTERKRQRKQTAENSLMGMRSLCRMISGRRSSLRQASNMDLLVFNQIDAEVQQFEAGSRKPGYISRYAYVHEISEDEAAVELSLQISRINSQLQKTQELYWRFRKEMIDRPLNTSEDLAAFENLLFTEAVLMFRI